LFTTTRITKGIKENHDNIATVYNVYLSPSVKLLSDGLKSLLSSSVPETHQYEKVKM
jgi:hypothetical protein